MVKRKRKSKQKSANNSKKQTKTWKRFSETGVGPLKTSSKKFLFPIIALLIIAVVYFFKSLLVVAVVNGQPITRIALVRELEKQIGAKTLDSLITKTLILQEIARQNVVVSPSEVDQELKKIEENLDAQGQKLEEVLISQGLTRTELAGQIQLQKQIEKIIGKNVSVSEEEVSEYIKKNEASFPKEYKAEQIKEMVEKQLRQQKLDEEFQAWLEDLQKKANIIRLVQF